MNIFVANHKTKNESLLKKYPNALILDVTSKSSYTGLRILSPFYPHGNIPVPGMEGVTATCVEAVWQGLKVFESCGVDYDLFKNDTMENLKRTVRKYGKPIGHQYGNILLNYQDARFFIYTPTYRFVLDKVSSVQETIIKIKEKSSVQDIVFLDYNTNCNPFDFSKPLSHAALVKMYIEGVYPTYEDYIKMECIDGKRKEVINNSGHYVGEQLELF